MKKLITSEAVTMGHPDKMCDMISDNILEAYLKEDNESRVACEVCASFKKVIVMGEITSKADIDIEKIVRKTILDIGYDDVSFGYDGNNVLVEIIVNKQSDDINKGITKSDLGAGDQGIMFGYATNETANFMPYGSYFANLLIEKLESVRINKQIPYLLPDGKAQVTVLVDNNKLIGLDTIIISSQHKKIDLDILRNDIEKQVIEKVIPKKLLKNTRIMINPAGNFMIGGPIADSGLTGRKIIVDSYGGGIPHGGGAFSGKDYTKVDRTAAYYARYVCKNIVASKLCDKMLLQVSYAIGFSKPISITIDTFNTNKISEEEILTIINKVFDFSPNNMIKELNLRHMPYSKTTCHSHFGKKGLSYEKLNKVSQIISLTNV